MKAVMRATFLNPFIEAATEVLEKELGSGVEMGSPAFQVSAYTRQEVTTVIGVTGRVQGIVLYGMSQKTAKDIAAKMVGTPCLEFDGLAQSAIGEIGNIVTGRATMNLVGAGYSVRLSPPILILGSRVLVSTLDLHRLMVPMYTGCGLVEIHLALREIE